MEEPSGRDQIYRHPRAEELTPGPTSRVASPSESLDVATVLKVFQSVSGEIVLERLIETLLRTAVEQSGAERGLLILPQGDELQVQAEATINGNSVTVIHAGAPVSSAAQPETVVQYVARTQENVILDDASAQGPFSNDEYFRRTHAQSILCLPVVKHGRLIAVLYLENKRASNAFTPARIAVLNVLASAAAISLENSRLYGEVQERESKISEKELRDLIAEMPAMAFSVRPDGSNEFASRRWQEYAGSWDEERAGRGWESTVHPDDFDLHLSKWRASLESGEPFENEVRHRAVTGEYRWFFGQGRAFAR